MQFTFNTDMVTLEPFTLLLNHQSNKVWIQALKDWYKNLKFSLKIASPCFHMETWGWVKSNPEKPNAPHPPDKPG